MLFRGFSFEIDFLSLGGLCTCSFSWVFWAKLAVGLVILARNPSAGALATLLVRDFGMSWPPGCDANDALEVFFASVEAVGAMGGLAADLLFCDAVTFLTFSVAVVLTRLAGRSETEFDLATEAAVGAVAAAGRRAGHVGDRGRALLFGEVGDTFFLTLLLVGTASEAFVLLARVGLGAAVAKEWRSDFGKVGDRRERFEFVIPDSSVAVGLGEETFFWAFGDMGVV
jgi:hypothetical protein